MNEYFFNFLLLLELSACLVNANVLLLPVLGAHRVSPCLENDTLKGLHSLAHLLVQLLLHRVQVELQVGAEPSDES